MPARSIYLNKVWILFLFTFLIGIDNLRNRDESVIVSLDKKTTFLWYLKSELYYKYLVARCL